MVKTLSTLLALFAFLAAPVASADDFAFGDVERGFVENLLRYSFNKSGDCSLGVEEKVDTETYTSDFLCTNSPLVRNIRFVLSPTSPSIGPTGKDCSSWTAEPGDDYNYGAICSINSEQRKIFANYMITIKVID